MNFRVPVALLLWMALLNPFVQSQAPPQAPPLHQGEKPYILFAVEDHTGERDEAGRPALSVLDPVAFLVNGEFSGCSSPAASPTQDDPGEELALLTIRKAYTKHTLHSIWFRGNPWGQAEAVKSCIEDVHPGESPMDWYGCVELHPTPNAQRLPKGPSAIAYTGPLSAPTHESVRTKSNEAERAVFLDAASAAYAEHHVHVLPNSIHVGTIWKTQLQSGHSTLIGNTVYQFPLKGRHVWSSVRLFLVLEETEGKFGPVLTHFNKAVFHSEPDSPSPKVGDILDEENSHDEEIFVDNFPLFTGEPDVIVTVHKYYEDWAYTIYRRHDGFYKQVYIGCGGGD